MKKILALAVGMLLIPFTAFGMQMMSDSDMDSITGQSGVAISLENIQIYMDEGGSELWYETSLGDGDAQAAVGLVYGDGSAQYLFINKVGAPGELLAGGSGYTNVSVAESDKNELLRGNYDPLAAMATDLANQGTRQLPSVLSIRVAQHNEEFGVFGDLGQSAFGFTEGADGAYIEIGLPTIEIFSVAGSQSELRAYVMGEGAYDDQTDLDPIGSGTGTNAAYSLGTVWTTDAGSTTTLLGGRLGITSLGQVPEQLSSSTYQSELNQ